MPTIQDLENDEDFKSLDRSTQMKMRRDFLRKVVAQDPDYKALSKERKTDINRRVLDIKKIEGPTKAQDAGAAILSGVASSLPTQVGFAITNPVRKALGANSLSADDFSYQPRTKTGAAAGMAANIAGEALLPGGAAVKGAKGGLSVLKTAGSAGLAGLMTGGSRSALDSHNKGEAPNPWNVAKSAAFEGGLSALGGGALAGAANAIRKARPAAVAPEAPAPAPARPVAPSVESREDIVGRIQTLKAERDRLRQVLRDAAARRPAPDLDADPYSMRGIEATPSDPEMRAAANELAGIERRILDAFYHPSLDTATKKQLMDLSIENSMKRRDKMLTDSRHSGASDQILRSPDEALAGENATGTDRKRSWEIVDEANRRAPEIEAQRQRLEADQGKIEKWMQDGQMAGSRRQMMERHLQLEDAIIQATRNGDHDEVLRLSKQLEELRRDFGLPAQREKRLPQGAGTPEPDIGKPEDTTLWKRILQDESGEAPIPGMGGGRPVGEAISVGEHHGNWRQGVEEFWHKFYSRFVDDLTHIGQGAERLAGRGNSGARDHIAYKTARLTRGNMGRVRSFIEDAPFDYHTGRRIEGVAPIRTIVRDVFENHGGEEGVQGLREYLVALRARELSDPARPGGPIETGIDLTSVNDAISRLGSQYQPYVEQIRAYQDAALRYAMDSGMLSEAAYQAMRQNNPNYIPFFRHLELDPMRSMGPEGVKPGRFANVTVPVRRINGSSERIIDPLESIMTNTRNFIAAAENNRVGLMLSDLTQNGYLRQVDPEAADALMRQVRPPQGGAHNVSAQLEEIADELSGTAGADLRALLHAHPEMAEQIITVFRPGAVRLSRNQVRVMRDGRPEYYQVHEDLYESLLGLDRAQLTPLVRLVSTPARWLRSMATVTPNFSFGNPVRDGLVAVMQNTAGFVAGRDSWRGLQSFWRQDEIYRAWQRHGGDASMQSFIDRESNQQELAHMLYNQNDRTPLAMTLRVINPLRLADNLRAFSDLMEGGTRVGMFMRDAEDKARQALQARGIQSPSRQQIREAIPDLSRQALDESAFASREGTLDFGRMGSQMQPWNSMSSFLNASVQGFDKMTRTLADPATRGRALIWGAALITLPTMILTAWNMRDPRYAKLEPWEKHSFYHFAVPNGPVLRLWKPPGYASIFGTPAQLAMEQLAGQNKDGAELVWEAVSNLLPGPVDLAPDVVVMGGEQLANFNTFTRRPIVGQGLDKLEGFRQYYPHTSTAAKGIGNATNISPARIEHGVESVAAGMGDLALKGLSLPFDLADSKRPDFGFQPQNLPGIGAFYSQVEKGGDQRIQRFYREAGRVERGDATFQQLIADFDKDRALEYGMSHKFDVGASEPMGSARELMANIRSYEEQVRRHPTMDRKEKAEFLRMAREKRGEIAQRYTDRIQELRSQRNQEPRQ